MAFVSSPIDWPCHEWLSDGKKKDYKGIIYDVGLWFILLISGIIASPIHENGY